MEKDTVEMFEKGLKQFEDPLGTIEAAAGQNGLLGSVFKKIEDIFDVESLISREKITEATLDHASHCMSDLRLLCELMRDSASSFSAGQLEFCSQKLIALFPVCKKALLLQAACMAVGELCYKLACFATVETRQRFTDIMEALNYPP